MLTAGPDRTSAAGARGCISAVDGRRVRWRCALARASGSPRLARAASRPCCSPRRSRLDAGALPSTPAGRASGSCARARSATAACSRARTTSSTAATRRAASPTCNHAFAEAAGRAARARWSARAFALPSATPTAKHGRRRGAAAYDQAVVTPFGTRWISWIETPVRSRAGGAEIQAVGRDVTDRHVAEAALAESARAGRGARARRSRASSPP